jgi:hypothetical protein
MLKGEKVWLAIVLALDLLASGYAYWLAKHGHAAPASCKESKLIAIRRSVSTTT